MKLSSFPPVVQAGAKAVGSALAFESFFGPVPLLLPTFLGSVDVFAGRGVARNLSKGDLTSAAKNVVQGFTLAAMAAGVSAVYTAARVAHFPYNAPFLPFSVPAAAALSLTASVVSASVGFAKELANPGRDPAL
jgi:hypothetical protein